MDTDELWNYKVTSVKYLNKQMYQDAVNLMIEHINDLDIQFCEMFINGFDITLSNLIPINLFEKIDSFNNDFRDFRTSIRWQLVRDKKIE